MTSATGDERNATEIAYWNGPGGERWRTHQEVQDALLAPVADVLLDRAAARRGEIVLDIGCGCGGTSIALARRVTPGGRVIGVDVSAPMLGRARERAPKDLPIEFVLADATVHAFAPGGADLLFSRFGVMFFADPARSFANIRRGLRQGARVVLACWRELRANPWMLLPLQQAYRHVPPLPQPGPDDPGPFSLAAEARVRDVLTRAGFGTIHLEPVDLAIDLAHGEGLDAAVDAALIIGPTCRALDGQPAERRAAATDSIRTALVPYRSGASVPLAGAIWIVTAAHP